MLGKPEGEGAADRRRDLVRVQTPGMQPFDLGVGSDVLPASPVALARDAYLRGDFGACERTLDDAATFSAADRREAVLLRARVLIRTLRFAEAVALLGPVLPTFVTVDEASTARMLHGAAVARTPGNLDRGLALLEDVAASAQGLGAHRAVRGEIAYMLAFVHWMKRDYDAVLRYADSAERARADVISVRAASLRGYVALAEERYPQALVLFRCALDAYRACRERDADLVERIVKEIAALEVALRSAKVLGTHVLPAEVGRVGEGTASDLPGTLRMEIAAFDAWLYAFDGQRAEAYHKIRMAESLAPDAARRVWALANRAQISLAFGDAGWAVEYAAEAFELYERVDWEATTDHERIALLHLAEILAQTHALLAATVLVRYDGMVTEMDRSLLIREDVRLWILETFVRGLVHRIRGETAAAWQAFESVRTEARRVGMVWRETLALIELDATPVAARPRGDHYLQAAALLVRKHFPRSVLARRLGRWQQAHRDPVAARLAPRPREVLRHFLAAKSAKEVATAMGLSEHTIKDYTETLFRAFGVHSKEELLVACYERGIGSPSWWNLLDESSNQPIVGQRLAAQRSGTRERGRTE